MSITQSELEKWKRETLLVLKETDSKQEVVSKLTSHLTEILMGRMLRLIDELTKRKEKNL